MEQEEVASVLELQRKAFDLLLWIGKSAASQPMLLSGESVESLKYAASCRAWIERMTGSFPVALRVEEKDLEAFSYLLSAFFSTSFRVEESKFVHYDSEIESYKTGTRRRLVANPPLSKAARQKAEQSSRNLQLIALEELAIENNIDLSNPQLQVLVERPDLAQPLSLWSYAHELVRRSRFASQGAGVYALWRALDESTRANLNADDVWRAREVLVEALGEAARPISST
jgi:hypothetical protein